MSTLSRTKKAAKPDVASLLPNSNELRELLAKESDRGAILIIAAHVEEVLGLLIGSICVSAEAAESLLKHGQPAGDFESRVVLAQTLGLIHETEVRALRMIQKIRNRAAHFDRTGRGFDVLFDSPATMDQVMALADIFGYTKFERQSKILRDTFLEIAENLSVVFFIRKLRTEQAKPAQSLEQLAIELIKEFGEELNEEQASILKVNTNHLSYNIVLYYYGLSVGALSEGMTLDELKKAFGKS
jgi:hypothetical protein